MSQFYSRYIPPPLSSLPKAEQDDNNLKRPAPAKVKKESKKRKLNDVQNGENATHQTDEKPHKTNHSKQNAPRLNALEKGTRKIAKDTNTGTPTTSHSTKTLKESHVEPNNEAREQSQDATTDDATYLKHTKVLSRFTKSKEKATQARQNRHDDASNHILDSDPADDDIVLHDLNPLPQPQSLTAVPKPPTYSAAPEWLKQPLRANSKLRRTFEDLGIHQKLLKNLKDQGKETALPIQSAVLPLILNKELKERPDLCVAAATGSGKTFAYILPILAALRERKAIRLRAVIVVPTRTLVKQVVQSIESCSAGLDVRVGTAEGTKSLSEEQKQLVEESIIYDPAEYIRRREAPIDWSAFSLEDLFDRVPANPLVSNVGYVSHYSSKIDVLVCTPGRLVEHLKITRGFSLQDVEWFVADEADRLLNESYHDWLEAVLPELRSQKATERRDNLLEHMFMHVPKRRVTKILLSATMTSDISQLLGLELTNPKLVLVDDEKPTEIVEDGVTSLATDNAEYQLPPRLSEAAVAFKDSENKPLYLIELLKMHIFAGSDKKQKAKTEVLSYRNTKQRPGQDRSDESSSDNPLDSEEDKEMNSSSSASSDSDSDSDSDTSSMSSTSSSSSDPSARSVSPTRTPRLEDSASSTQQQPQERVLIFTRSTESAHRLSRLLSILLPSFSQQIATFTRSSSTSDKKANRSLHRTRTKILTDFVKGTTRVLISTDLAARGLDIANLEHVINYDVPTSALTYVHRVGRTARAGHEGHAWTLVEHKQGKWFWETIAGKNVKEGGTKAIGRGTRTIAKVNLQFDKEIWMNKYEEALQRLGEDVRGQQ